LIRVSSPRQQEEEEERIVKKGARENKGRSLELGLARVRVG
jgi:hypothetical protein